jgi:hypothetical protein
MPPTPRRSARRYGGRHRAKSRDAELPSEFRVQCNLRASAVDEKSHFGAAVHAHADQRQRICPQKFQTRYLPVVQGTFSGGQHAEVQQGRIESLTVGDWTVRNLPVAMLPLRQLSERGAKRIDGIIGTTLFYHFLATLDYPKGELVLRRKDAASLEQFVASAGKSIAVPFWVASDHFMVGWGRVETLPPTLLFVDTGLASAGVKLAESVINEAGIKLEEDKASSGAGGAAERLGSCRMSCVAFRLGSCGKTTFRGSTTGPFPGKTSSAFTSPVWSVTTSSSRMR